MEGLFDSLHLPDIKKLRIENNEFSLKHKFRLKMLSILYVSDPKWKKMLYALFTETIKNKQGKCREIEKFWLKTFFWETIECKIQMKLTM